MHTEDAFDMLLRFLRQEHGFDFSGYKRAGLTRRIRKRMQAVSVESFEAYRDYLEAHPSEYSLLVRTILIKVTGFFRDPDAWRFLSVKVVPELVAHRGSGPIRTWCAGCSSGEEVYTLVMVLAEALGRERCREQVTVHATDVAEDALAQARQASYSASSLEAVPPELRDRYFVPIGNRYVFDEDLRGSVSFARHDLTQDAPVSQLDLLSCRNTLMYFDAETQQRIVSQLHGALDAGGYLFLGRAEMLLPNNHGFRAADLKARIFTKPLWSHLRAAAPLIPPAEQCASVGAGRATGS